MTPQGDLKDGFLLVICNPIFLGICVMFLVCGLKEWRAGCRKH